MIEILCKQCGNVIDQGNLFLSAYKLRKFCNGGCRSDWIRAHKQKGHKQTKETREKIRKKMLGRKITWNDKLKGRKCSKETRKKMSKARIGTKESKATKEKQRQAKLKNPTQMFGADNPMWKGGPSKKKYLRDELKTLASYKIWRRAVFIRDRFTCTKCRVKGKTLNAHHIVNIKDIFLEYQITILEEALTCEILWAISNGITLCVDCHKKEHGKNKK